MKPYRIKKAFSGNQTGYGDTEHFVEGTIAQITDTLAEIALKEGWIEIASIEPRKLSDGEMLEEVEAPAGEYATKVIEPEETKPGKPVAKKGKK